MILTTHVIEDSLKEYSNTPCKLSRLVRDGKYHRIIRGLYETDKDTPGEYLAQAICNPSYLSFEFALSRYGLIPEAVFKYTSASFRKKRAKRYETSFGTFTYADVPEKVFPYGVVYVSDDRGGYWIAGPEKALCDKVYSISPVGSEKAMVTLLFDDLRIDDDAFMRLDIERLETISEIYGSKNVRLLTKVRRKMDGDILKIV